MIAIFSALEEEVRDLKKGMSINKNFRLSRLPDI